MSKLGKGTFLQEKLRLMDNNTGNIIQLSQCRFVYVFISNSRHKLGITVTEELKGKGEKPSSYLRMNDAYIRDPCDPPRRTYKLALVGRRRAVIHVPRAQRPLQALFHGVTLVSVLLRVACSLLAEQGVVEGLDRRDAAAHHDDEQLGARPDEKIVRIP
jgi:hypothetical protein